MGKVYSRKRTGRQTGSQLLSQQFKTVAVRMADGTNRRGRFPRAQVSAHTAPPDRVGGMNSFFSRHSSFRYGLRLFFP